jgi:ABC-type molybdate transport system ATPase subunit
MIFVSHAQAEVDYLADQVIPMTAGRLDPAVPQSG